MSTPVECFVTAFDESLFYAPGILMGAVGAGVLAVSTYFFMDQLYSA